MIHQTSPSAPLPLRQSRHHRQNTSFDRFHTFRPNDPTSHEVNDMLQLSMHMPSRPFNNRFELLSVTQPAAEPRNQFHVPSRYRRSRNSRGTKEAKRRRDARRSRRKLAAQLLDEQLSRDIDATLNKVDMFPHVNHSTPIPILPASGFQHISAPSIASSVPPQLPDFDFPAINMDFVPQLATLPKTSPPPTTPLAFCIPSWCPNVPALTRGLWTDCLPEFFDLSSLPEPKEPAFTLTSSTSKNDCQELQLWRGNDPLKPKQSRFFPAHQSPPKPIVRLPTPSACTLHIKEKILPSGLLADSAAPHREFLGAVGGNAASTSWITEMIAELEAPQAPRCKVTTPVLESSAASLWRILMDQNDSLEVRAASDPYVASLDSETAEEHYATAWSSALATCPVFNKTAEVDSTEVPYVHANSLTDDELGLSPYIDEHPSMRDSAVCGVVLPSPPLGLNELMIDNEIVEHCCLDNEYLNDIEQVSLSNDAPTTTAPEGMDTDAVYPPIMPPFVLTDVLPVDCVVTPTTEKDTENILTKSDAHFLSEQSLFDLHSQQAFTALQNQSGPSRIDLADFLKLGHAKNCWCHDCEQEIPELVPREKMEEGEDEWMLYSPCSTFETGSETAVESVGDERDGEVGVARSTDQDMSSSWQDWYPAENAAEAWELALERYKHEQDKEACAPEVEARTTEEWDYWT